MTNFVVRLLDHYVLEDFDAKPSFSSFLPAVAGVYGIPVWSFYINRGQGVASFGFKSKEFPILEYVSAVRCGLVYCCTDRSCPARLGSCTRVAKH